MRKDRVQIVLYPETHFRRAIMDKITHSFWDDDNRCSWSLLELRSLLLAVILPCLSEAPRNAGFLYILCKVFPSKPIPLWTKEQAILTTCSTKLKVWFGMGQAQSHLQGNVWVRIYWYKITPAQMKQGRKLHENSSFYKVSCLLLWICPTAGYRRRDMINLLWQYVLLAFPQVLLSVS